MKDLIWICSNKHRIKAKDWPYEKLAKDGNPICGIKMEDGEDCNEDMELIDKKELDYD